MLEFASGFAVEFTAVFWAHFAERNKAAHTALVSAVQAAALFLGVHGSLPCFVAGYALGAWVAVRIKSLVYDRP